MVGEEEEKGDKLGNLVDGRNEGAMEGMGILDGEVDSSDCCGVGELDGDNSEGNKTSTVTTVLYTGCCRSNQRNLTRPPAPRLNPSSTMAVTLSAESGVGEETCTICSSATSKTNKPSSSRPTLTREVGPNLHW